LAGVALEVPGTALRAVSRADGRFTILRVPAGGQSVQARYIGFAPQSVSVMVTPGGVAQVRLELRPQAVEIEGIEVVGLQVGQAAALNQQLNAI
ncbi:MAG: carboxypeptidase regulatory-like domain-containing protein, partial [Gemmatimonadetes bacterium]|nr:carboxypeptidase regulatory-like domain-containing protein [Gemmatimonadota bacterium]